METIPNLTNARALESLTFWRETHARQARKVPHMTPARKPRFDYKNLPDSKRLHYELLTWDNFRQVLDLFENDENPFISKEFKTLERLEDYAVAQLEYNRYSFKWGACDWFLHSKETNELIGILHIYQLNWEFSDGKHPACMFGYGITEKFRRQGFAHEAAKHLLKQIPLIFKRYEVYANPKNANIASCDLLKKLGFTMKRTIGKDKDESLWYKKLVKKIPIKSFETFLEEESRYR